jgi:Trk K+ transport system NAD-binding subunit
MSSLAASVRGPSEDDDAGCTGQATAVDSRAGLVLVCGLGSLGQACLSRLLSFDVPLAGLDLEPPSRLDPSLRQRLGAGLLQGDMRQPGDLQRAGLHQARAVLLLSSDGSVNVEAALQCRLLNPDATIVLRSSSRQASLGALLEARLPGLAVVDPALLATGAISGALRPGEAAASFEADGQLYHLVEGPRQDPHWQRPVQLPDQAGGGGSDLLLTPGSFHPLGVAPTAAGQRAEAVAGVTALPRRLLAPLARRSRAQWLAVGALALLLVIGPQLFSQPGSWRQGMFVTLALLKGEYVDPVNVLLDGGAGLAEASGWLITGTLLYSLVGTLLTSALVAVLLERLLRDRLVRRRPARLRRGLRPVLLVEGGDLARGVAHALQRQKLPVVRVQPGEDWEDQKAGTPIYESVDAALTALRGSRVSAVGLLSPDLLANLEAALALQRRWPEARLAVLAHALAAAPRLGELLGGVTVISAVDLAADALVATAFGERVEGVVGIGGHHLLLVRYRIAPGDTLLGRTIARLEHGYGVTAVSLRRRGSATVIELPACDLVVATGDAVLVLATLKGLRRIERGEAVPPAWRLRLRVPDGVEGEARFECQQCLARWLGCAPGETTGLLARTEALTPLLDREPAERLHAELRRLGIFSQLEGQLPGQRQLEPQP